MNALVRKEIRQLLPTWITAMILSIAPAWLTPLWVFHHGDDARALAFAAFCFGTLLVSLSTFGQEFGAGTFQQLLSQPASRRLLWRVKSTTLGLALALAFVAFLGSYRFRIAGLEEVSSFGFLAVFSATTALALASGALFTTLLFRQVAAGFWLSIFAPVMVLYSVFVILEKIFVVSAPLPEWTELVLLAAYAVAGFLWAQRLFLRAQDIQWTGGNIVLPSWLQRGGRVRTSGGPWKGRSQMRTLFWKEVQLQQVGLLVGGTALFLQLVCIGIKAVDQDTEGTGKAYWGVLAGWITLWAALPFLLGCMAVAEERRLATLESALSLPIKTRYQFAAKLSVAILLAVVLGALLPWLIGGVFGFVSGAGPFEQGFARDELWVLALLMTGVTLVGFYASTLSRTTLQAMGVAVVAIACLVYLLIGSTNPMEAFGIPLWVGWRLPALMGTPILTLCLVGLGFQNYRRPQIGRGDWIRNLAVWALCVGCGFTAISATYYRSWEYFTRLEPAHGPRQLFGPVRPKIGLSGRKLFVLLPDGRLWVTKHSKDQFLYVNREGREARNIYYPVPIDGEFVGGSNWVRLATDWRRVFGIQSDGTLWRFLVPPDRYEFTNVQPERVGEDSNWSDVAAGAGFFLFVKTDGTLWGWGYNNQNQLGSGPGVFTNDLVRVGTNSDWSAVFANMSTSVGVKRDGSVWKWGSLLAGPHSRWGWKNEAYDEPIRWDLNGADWVEVVGLNCDLALHRDGSLWLSGMLANNILGASFHEDFSEKPIRIGRESEWADISVMDNRILAVKKDGTLVKSDVLWQPHPFSVDFLHEPSSYADWLTVQASWSDPYVALAADGTLCCWWDRDPEWTGAGRSWLGPTRRPLWSLNILASTK